MGNRYSSPIVVVIYIYNSTYTAALYPETRKYRYSLLVTAKSPKNVGESEERRLSIGQRNETRNEQKRSSRFINEQILRFLGWFSFLFFR